MAAQIEIEQERGKSAALRLAEEIQKRPYATAAFVGGAAAATAGAFFGARALRRRAAAGGEPVNQVLSTALTASEVARNGHPRGEVPVNAPAATTPA